MIEVRHSHIAITNYELGKYEKIEKMLSVWDNVTFSYTWRNYYYNESKKELRIPRGLDINKLSFMCKEEEIFTKTRPANSTKATYNMTVNPRDNKQVESIKFLLGKTEESANSTERMLCLETGGGKTYCTINALSRLSKRSIIVVDKDKIMKQWKKEFLSFTDLEEDDIYFISGASSINKLLKMNTSEIQHKVFIAMHQTLTAYEKHGELADLFNKIKVGVTVFDEAHCYAGSMFNLNMVTDTALTIYLTATPSRSHERENTVYQRSLMCVPKYGLEAKFDNLYHNVVYVSYDTHPTFTDLAKSSTQRGFNTNYYSDYSMMANFDTTYNHICSILDLTLKQGTGKTCIILHKNDHVLKLKEAIETDYNEECGVFTSLVNAKDREKELEKKIIISTDKSMNKAVDIKDLQFVIMTVPTSSAVIAEQTLGRLRRLPDKEVIYFDLLDTGFKAAVQQRNRRKQILNKKAKSIKLLSL